MTDANFERNMKALLNQIWMILVRRDIRRFTKEMKAEDRELMRDCTKEHLIKFHRGHGRYLRNEFRSGHYRGLCGHCHKLVRSKGEDLSFDAPSSVAIELIWEALTSQKERN